MLERYFSEDPEAGEVLGLARHPVPPLYLGALVVLAGGVLGGPQEGGVISVGRGVNLRSHRQQLLQLSLQAVVEAGDEGEAAREEDGARHLLPRVQTALCDGFFDQNMNPSLVQPRPAWPPREGHRHGLTNQLFQVWIK